MRSPNRAKIAVKITIARMKLAIGPAATMAARAAKGFALEAPRPLLRRQLLERFLARACGILVVDEFHVAAERNPGQPPARAVPVVEAHDLRTEADREGLDRHAAPAGHQEMAELVDEDHDGQDEQERKKIAEQRVAEAGKLNQGVHRYGGYP